MDWRCGSSSKQPINIHNAKVICKINMNGKRNGVGVGVGSVMTL
jgi:hypothetical protein